MNSQIAQTYSIFEQPWWLDATAPGQWDAIEVDEGGKTIARLPFILKKKYGLRIIGQPQLTQTLGPWIEQASSDHSRSLKRRRDLTQKLISKLPKYDIFSQSFHPSITDWLPFHWENFSQTTKYTYVLKDLRNPTELLERMSQSSRYSIKRAAKLISVVESDGIEEVARLAEKTFRRQGLDMPYSFDLLNRIDEAAKAYGQRRALLGIDSDGRIHSAAYLVGDHRRAYLLVSGADPELRQSGSGNLVHWAAIEAAAEFTKVFDFEGSMIRPVESFYRGFGAMQTPYHAISKQGKFVTLAASLSQLLHK
ncbi:GNAT family N-acetyltransferase [Glutamicibacter protophormiae]|uniref:Lipid II:glycine glycyltransferase (Peptidoglycan interpeptide bridge formation enzyme) n=1 Tax=Glutamicibacter protophormiae TaxID=37930 RepID=A0ABS4XSJ6_GLUPR|nr:GNAT family N-acetyltransferase [Glutamicibacter protophormiae]MBP2399320.1 lipid II:glycine glycyltransferase (peptidoglycan interpeptide bridge formation enzyme) [Glutamicibacter protophormiae]GGM00635.1 hypothetical protein GCM10010038_33390 [Glutamicibacter protophormiae]